MPTMLFHVSKKQYQPDQVVALLEGETTEYLQRLSAAHNDSVEGLLNTYRPTVAQDRQTTQYAFANVHDCRLYGESQYPNQQLQYYCVSMKNPTKVPMAMVNVIKQQHDATANQLAKMAGEYWTPSMTWQVYEFLSNSMTIVNETTRPDDEMELYAAQARYSDDIDLAKKFCAKVKDSV